MSFSKSCLELLSNTILNNNLNQKEKSCCILGFPSTSVDLTTLNKVFDKSINEPTFHSILKTYSYTDIKVLDFSDYQGAELVFNLNEKLSDSIDKFDLVIDNGTTEHCYNVGQAMMNTASLCKVGGKIFHLNPANWFGHGFWNFNPCTYYDFYNENGFEVDVYLRDISTGISKKIVYKPDNTDILPSTRFTTHAVATRNDLRPLKFPTQSRFKHLG